MARLLIIAGETKEVKELAQGLSRAGFQFSFVSRAEAKETITADPPDLILWQVTGTETPALIQDVLNKKAEEKPLPLVGLIAREQIAGISPEFPFDDFIVSPFDGGELLLRIKRLLGTNGTGEAGGYIKAGDLIIDSSKAEVLIAGHRVEVTYREYELLRFLASNPGRVFSREALLNRVWGYDYYGGDRTVDVHIRRLRSKIETDKLSFIETVRNIGYRFRDDLDAKII